MFKVIIAGGRDFEALKLLTRKCDYFLKNVKSEIEIVSGNAKGADTCAIMYACEKGYKCKVMKADWDTNGKSAGFLRNLEMANYADAAIVFWDGRSKGSKHMIDTMKIMRKPVRVIMYEQRYDESSKSYQCIFVKHNQSW